VRPGDLDPGANVEMRQAPVEERSRHDANVHHVDATRRQSADERLAQCLPAGPVVASDSHRPAHVVVREEGRERAANDGGCVDGQVVANDAADVVLAKDSGG
jgi:hypothetical protein